VSGPVDLSSLRTALLVFGIIVTVLACRTLLGRGPEQALDGREQISRELDMISARLIRLEAKVAGVGATTNGHPAELTEMTADVGLLSGLVKNLAESLGAQGRDLADMRERLAGLGGWGPVARLDTALPRAEGRPSTPSLLPSSSDDGGTGAPSSRAAPPAPPGAGRPVDRRRTAILDALDDKRLELYLQPIVSLPQRQPRMYEGLARLRLADGTVLLPADFLPVLEDAGRLARLDEIVVRRAALLLAQMSRRDRSVRVACNVGAPSLRDAGWLAAVERFAADDPTSAGRLVLELSQSTWRGLRPDGLEILSGLSARGVAVALDNVTDLALDPAFLERCGIRLVKAPVDVLLRPAPDPTGLATSETGPAMQVARLAQHGIEVAAERIEREADIPELIDLDVALAQGYALGMPRPFRIDASASETVDRPEARPAPPSPVLPAEEPPRGGDGEGRKPLRDFLRRAG
jgi:cyclic-di-GMP phosphodiesterase TipF (flagellum assembly factor)